MVITRDDIPELPEISQVHPDAWHPVFTTDHSYLYSFPNNSLPPNFNIRLEGLDSGHSVLLGFCTPFNATPDEVKFTGTPIPIGDIVNAMYNFHNFTEIFGQILY